MSECVLGELDSFKEEKYYCHITLGKALESGPSVCSDLLSLYMPIKGEK